MSSINQDKLLETVQAAVKDAIVKMIEQGISVGGNIDLTVSAMNESDTIHRTYIELLERADGSWTVETMSSDIM